MSMWLAALLGLVQGLTEFLPVSSSGHLVIIQSFLGRDIEHDYILFDVLLHFGTLVSVCFCFWPDIRDMALEGVAWLRELFGGPKAEPRPARRLLWLIFIASLPMLAVPLINDFVESLFTSPLFVGCMLLVTAALLYFADRYGRGRKNLPQADWRDALVVGLLQLVAILPGVSRSGTAITGGSLRGFRRDFAVKFSFLMSIPVILGANIFTLSDAFAQGFDTALLGPYVLGMVCAAAAGIGAINLVRRLAKRQNFRVFVFYCLGAGLLTIILSFII